jgi:hypothetical protein
VSKHRRPPATPAGRAARRLAGQAEARRLPQPLADILMWGALSAVVVPLVMVWTGADWPAALGVGGLLVGLVGVCALALRFSGVVVRGRNDGDVDAERDEGAAPGP